MNGSFSIRQLLRRFSSEEKCIQWLEQARWDGRPVCPHCGGVENISTPKSKAFTYWHRDCRKYFTVKTGTVLHSTKTPTQNWMAAIFSVLTARNGLSAMRLSKELGVQYRTAWHMLHRIREACGNGEFTLTRAIEVDESHIGGKEISEQELQRLRMGRGTVGSASHDRRTRIPPKPIRATDSRSPVTDRDTSNEEEAA